MLVATNILITICKYQINSSSPVVKYLDFQTVEMTVAGEGGNDMKAV